jgi:hypothetical protein
VPVNSLISVNATRISNINAGSTFMTAVSGKVVYTWGDNSRGQAGQLNSSSVIIPTIAPLPFSYPVPVAVITSIDPTFAASSSPQYAGATGGGGSSYLLVQGVTCYGLFQEDPKVCSAQGECIAQDTCVCQIFYNGPDCSTFNCYGVSHCQ